MATEEIVMTIKSNIKSQTEDTKKFADALGDAKKESEELNENISVQNKVLLDMEKELLRLEAVQGRIGKGTWQDSLTGTTKKIDAQKQAIKEEKLALKSLTLEQKENTSSLKKASDERKEMDKTIKDGIGSFNIMGVSIAGLRNSLKKVIPFIKLMFGTVRAGIISTGVGVLLIAFGSLVAFFTKTAEGAEKLKVAFAGIGAAVDVLVDRLSNVGEGLLMLWNGDVKKGFASIRDSFKGVINEIKNESAAAMELQIALTALEKTERIFIKTKAEANQEIAKSRLLAKDESKSLEERKVALESAVQLEKKILAEEINNQKERVRIATAKTGLAKSKEEDLAALQEQEVKLIELETKSFKKQKTLATELNRLNKKIAADKKKIIDDEIALAKTREELQAEEDQLFLDRKKTFEDKLINLKNATTLLLIEDEKARQEKQLELQLEAEIRSIDALKISEDQKIKLKEAANDKYAASIIKNDKAVADNQKDLQKAQIGAAINFAGQLNSLAGESKAVSAGLALIDTFVAVQSVMADKAIPSTALKLLTAGGILAQGLNNVKQIYAVDVGSGASGSAPNISNNTPAPEMLSGKFSLSNVENEQQPVQAYVVTDSLTENQNKLAYIRRRATI